MNAKGISKVAILKEESWVLVFGHIAHLVQFVHEKAHGKNGKHQQVSDSILESTGYAFLLIGAAAPAVSCI